MAADRVHARAPRLGGLRIAEATVLASIVVVATLVRWRTRHEGLIYPDGYQYLMMAKGIGAHLTPTLALGHGGELFSPSVDAALKPLFPALVAAISTVVRVQVAAQVVTAVSAGTAVALLLALVWALTGSRVAAVTAGAGALANPMLDYWAGYSGPDPLAEALALACAIAAVRRRSVLAGMLGGLCAATRPEWGVALAAAALAALVRPGWREDAGRALLAAVFTLAVVIGVVRPPLALPAGGAVGVVCALAAAVAGQWLAQRAAASTVGRPAYVATAALAVAAVALSGRSPALTSLLGGNWPLIAVALAGAFAACFGPAGRAVPIVLATVAVPFAAYEYRNPSSVRYLSELIIPLCLLAAIGLPQLARAMAASRRADWLMASRGVALGAFAAGLVLPVIVCPTQPAVGRDYFQTVALWLRHAPPGPLVSAAPDAFGVLLPTRPERQLAPGARGLILLDASQREYAAARAATGRSVATLMPAEGFARPDGSLDMAPARLLEGEVTR